MTETYANLVHDARQFFAELDANNTKEWFDGQKPRYVKTIRQPAEDLAAVMAENLSRLTDLALNSKVYRINRDVRFSHDKGPYNTHLHILWSSGEKDRADWFLEVSPTSFSLSTGVVAFSAGGLDRIRNAIADDPKPWIDALNTIRAIGGDVADWGEPALKRVPKPWDQDHPAADLLRRKSLIMTLPMNCENLSPGPVAVLRTAAEHLLPFFACIYGGTE